MGRVIWIVSGICIIAAVAVAYFTIRPDQVPTPTAEPVSSGTGNAPVGANGQSTIVMYSDTGFSPKEITISPGTTVTWSNESSKDLWVSDQDEPDEECTAAATVFNECTSVSHGGSYSFTFTTPGTFTYVNNAQDTDIGTIIVREDSSTSSSNGMNGTPI